MKCPALVAIVNKIIRRLYFFIFLKYVLRWKKLFVLGRTVNMKYVTWVAEIPKSILKLLRNPVYALLLPAISCEIAIVSGFVVFLPKYIETQFGTSTSVANLFTGTQALQCI